MVDKGTTAKLAPLALVPNKVPPTAALYQRMVLPAEVAVKLAVAPGQTGLGVAVNAVGTPGATPVTVTVTAVLEQLITEVPALNASA